MKVYKD